MFCKKRGLFYDHIKIQKVYSILFFFFFTFFPILMSYVTFQGYIEKGSHKTGGSLNTGLINMKCSVKGG
jgi:hypothetical protein